MNPQSRIRANSLSRSIRLFIYLCFILFVSSTFVLADEKCPYDGMSMYFNGKTKSEWGKLFYQYQCPSSHKWWIDPTKPSKSDYSQKKTLTCPTCSMSVYWTGKTYTEWGKLYKIYKCPSGHQSIGPYN